MAESLAAPSEEAGSDPLGAEAQPNRLERLSSFRVTYAAILAYVVLLMLSVWVADRALNLHFREAVSRAILVNPANGPIIPQVENRVRRLIRDSFWTRYGDVRSLSKGGATSSLGSRSGWYSTESTRDWVR